MRRNWKYSRLTFNTAFLLLTALSLSCNMPSSNKSSAGQQSGPAKINERAESGGIALTVVKATRQVAIGQFQKADKDKTFLVTEVIIETTDRDKAPYNPMYFKVKDSSGVEYNSTISTAGDSLKSGELAKGDKVRGTVAFEINKDSKGLVLSYEPIVIMGGYEPIRVALE